MVQNNPPVVYISIVDCKQVSCWHRVVSGVGVVRDKRKTETRQGREQSKDESREEAKTKQRREQSRDDSRAETRRRIEEKQSGAETKTGRVPCFEREMSEQELACFSRSFIGSARSNDRHAHTNKAHIWRTRAAHARYAAHAPQACGNTGFNEAVI